eukprot:7995965-Karenia_brevis.AAC.1
MCIRDSTWFVSVLHDLASVLPGVLIQFGECEYGPFLYSTGWFSDDGFWVSAQPYSLPLDICGRRRVPPELSTRFALVVRKHVKNVCAQFRMLITRLNQNDLLQRILLRASQDPYSKIDLLSKRLCSHGPPLCLSLSWCGAALHQAAVSCLFSGDLCLARYAANFYARDLCPQKAHHIAQVTSKNLHPHRVCLFCWHTNRQIVGEDETHVLFECPFFQSARSILFSRLCAHTRQMLSTAARDKYGEASVGNVNCLHLTKNNDSDIVSPLVAPHGARRGIQFAGTA